MISVLDQVKFLLGRKGIPMFQRRKITAWMFSPSLIGIFVCMSFFVTSATLTYAYPAKSLGTQTDVKVYRATDSTVGAVSYVLGSDPSNSHCVDTPNQGSNNLNDIGTFDSNNHIILTMYPNAQCQTWDNNTTAPKKTYSGKVGGIKSASNLTCGSNCVVFDVPAFSAQKPTTLQILRPQGSQVGAVKIWDVTQNRSVGGCTDTPNQGQAVTIGTFDSHDYINIDAYQDAQCNVWFRDSQHGVRVSSGSDCARDHTCKQFTVNESTLWQPN